MLRSTLSLQPTYTIPTVRLYKIFCLNFNYAIHISSPPMSHTWPLLHTRLYHSALFYRPFVMPNQWTLNLCDRSLSRFLLVPCSSAPRLLYFSPLPQSPFPLRTVANPNRRAFQPSCLAKYKRIHRQATHVLDRITPFRGTKARLRRSSRGKTRMRWQTFLHEHIILVPYARGSLIALLRQEA